MTARPPLRFAAATLVAAGAALAADEIRVAAKAALAVRLIDRALADRLADGGVHRPWPWADHWPVAEVRVPRLGVRRPVLAGASGGTLAFGLGHLDGTALPGAPGTSIVSGHRDTFAEFLRHLRPGDRIEVATHGGTRRYRVAETTVLVGTETLFMEEHGVDRLVVVTCWPFDGLVRATSRYAVVAVPDRASPGRGCAPPRET